MTDTTSDLPFFWCVGIEDTAIGASIRDGGRPLDEYHLTGHYARWRADLELVAELGCTAVRYGLPWYRINPAPGEWDWSFPDAVLEYAAGHLGLTVIADLVHYGTPTWLGGAFTDPGYPAAVAAFGGAVARRYGGLVSHYTPVNEPLVTASFCGRRGVWPPYDHGDAGWARVVVGVADGIQRTTRAIRAEAPDAVITHVEAAGLWFTEDAGLHAEAAAQNDRKFLPTDLVTGAVTTEHPQHGFLTGAGVPAATLARLRDAAQLPDLIGVNYYPTLSGRELVRRGGEVIEVAARTGAAGLSTVLTEYHERYRRPVFLSETALDGEPADHIAWLRESTEAVADLRASGVPVTGYTWWPLFDFVDWAWASGGRVVEEFHVRDADGAIRAVAPPHGDDVTAYLRRMGLYRLVRTGADLTTQTTPAVTEFRKLAGQPAPEPRNRP